MREPFKFRLEELSEEFGLTPITKAVLSTAGIMTYKEVGLALLAGKVLYRMAKRREARNIIKNLLVTSKKATEAPFNITPFMATLLEMDEEFAD